MFHFQVSRTSPLRLQMLTRNEGLLLKRLNTTEVLPPVEPASRLEAPLYIALDDSRERRRRGPSPGFPRRRESDAESESPSLLPAKGRNSRPSWRSISVSHSVTLSAVWPGDLLAEVRTRRSVHVRVRYNSAVCVGGSDYF